MSLCFPLAKKRTLDLSGRRVNWFNRVEARTSPRFFDVFLVSRGLFMTYMTCHISWRQTTHERMPLCNNLDRMWSLLWMHTTCRIRCCHDPLHVWLNTQMCRISCSNDRSAHSSYSSHSHLGLFGDISVSLLVYLWHSHHLPPFPEHSWARWSIFPYDWQQRSVVAALQIMDFLCFLYHLHGLRHHNSDEFPCFKRLVVDLLRLVFLMRFSGQPCIRIDEHSGCTGLLGILEGALYVSECRWDPLKGWWIDAWHVGIITWYHWFGRTFKNISKFQLVMVFQRPVSHIFHALHSWSWIGHPGSSWLLSQFEL